MYVETALYESEQFAANCSVRLRQTLQETGPADAGIGAKFILSLRFSFRQTAGTAEMACKPIYVSHAIYHFAFFIPYFGLYT